MQCMMVYISLRVLSEVAIYYLCSNKPHNNLPLQKKRLLSRFFLWYYTDMNDKQIECFLETGKHLSFTKAAQNLYLPQPAVSRYISALEQELGTTLFVRENSRNIALSESGKIYFNLFQRFNAELTNIRRMLSTSTTILRLGYNVGWNVSYFLPEVVKRCKSINPDFQITFECLGFKELTYSLEDKRLDAIITTDDYLENRTEFVRRKFTSIDRIIVYSELIPNCETINSPKDLCNYTFYMVDDPRIGELCQDIEILFRPYGFIPKFTAVPNISTVFANVENGLGVAVLDGWYQGIHHPGIHTLNLCENLPISMAWHRSTTSQAIELLYSQLASYFTTG